MPNYNSTHTGAQIDNVVTNALLRSEAASLYQPLGGSSVTTQINDAVAAAKLAMFPVGSIYMTINNTNPSTFIGGTWVQIEDTFLLSAGQTYSAGDTGGKASYTAADMPAHTHDRGTMEITGTLYGSDCTFGTYNSGGNGAFYTTGTRGNYMFGRGGVDVNSPNYRDIAFSAARNWSGETSQSGTNETATIMPPYLVVYIWQRTA